MTVSPRELRAADMVARLMDSVDAGDRENTARIVASYPKDDLGIVVLTLAGLLHEEESHRTRSTDEFERERASLREQLRAAVAERDKFRAAYLDGRNRVTELRGLLDQAAARFPKKKAA